MTDRCGHITSLADVRRHAYSALHQDAMQLSSAQLLELRRQPYGGARYQALADMLGVAPAQFAHPGIEGAFEAYYSTRLNAAPLDDYAQMLVAIASGHALGPWGTAYLLEVMERVQTGRQRIIAGLPAQVRFAHKTGTQLRRQCDFGIVRTGAGAQARALAVAACNRGARTLAGGEAALRAVGAALHASGALSPAPTASMHAQAPASTGPGRAANAAGARALPE